MWGVRRQLCGGKQLWKTTAVAEVVDSRWCLGRRGGRRQAREHGRGGIGRVEGQRGVDSNGGTKGGWKRGKGEREEGEEGEAKNTKGTKDMSLLKNNNKIYFWIAETLTD